MGEAARRLIEIPFSPRRHQQDVVDALRRFSVLVCHRRFGKTVLAVNLLIRSAIECPHRAPRLAYLAPLFRQAKQIAWDYLRHYLGVIPGVRFYETELRADLPNGARVQLFGCDNPDALRGMYLDGVVLDEYAQMPPRLWGEVVRPALSDREGWALFAGTPQGRNQFCELYEQAVANPEWYAGMFRASETGIIPAAELALARQTMSPEQYAQEYECSWSAAILGSYYGRALDEAEAAGRVGRVPVDPGLRVDTAWDLGIDDATAIWFVQRVGRETRLVDYYEARGEGLPHYARVLQERGYVYGTHYGPHDLGVRELGTGRSRIETAADLGLRFEVVPQLPVADGIEAVRRLLPQTWIDAEHCRDGLEALRQYRAEWNERREVGTRPVHDWASHAADALRYYAIGVQTEREPLAAPKKRPVCHGAGAWMS